MRKNLTEIVFILDRSGSMRGLEADTIGGFNSMIEKQQKAEGDALISTVLFDNTSEVIHDRVDVKCIKPMTDEDYTVRGCTALLDAIGGAIHHVGNVHKYARAEDVPEHTLFVITTDGMENASRRYDSDKVKKMIERQKEKYRMQEGLYKFSVRNTIGYYRDYSGRIKVEPAEARIVEYIFESFLEGASPQEIADSLTEQGIRSPKGMERWRQATIRSILSNEKYCGDVLYQKTYSKDYLTHKSVKNRDVLPQYYWENNHTAIIDRETWQKAQELLSSGNFGRHGKPLAAMKKKFVVAKVKSGVLRGFMLLDMDWTKEERDTVIKIIENTELDLNQAERSQDYGY